MSHSKISAKAPWSIRDLNLLLASARTMPGQVSDIPGRLWWPALTLLLLDSGQGVSDVVLAPRSGYSVHTGTLALGCYVFRLHPLSIEALEAIRRHEGPRLLPWPWDHGRSPFHILYRRYRHLLYRAGLPHVTEHLFDRLRLTAMRVPDVLDHVNPRLPFRPNEVKPHLARASDRQRWDRTPAPKNPTGRNGHNRLEDIVTITSESERTLKRFFEDIYRPLRLVAASPATASGYCIVIHKLGHFRGCDVTVDQGFIGCLLGAPARRGGGLGFDLFGSGRAVVDGDAVDLL